MNRNRIFTVTLMSLLAISLVATTACKSGGMAVTSRGQLLKLNIEHPKDLPDNGEDNLDVNISNRGANNVTNVLLDVELPSQLVVLDQTNERGIQVTRDPASKRLSLCVREHSADRELAHPLQGAHGVRDDA